MTFFPELFSNSWRIDSAWIFFIGLVERAREVLMIKTHSFRNKVVLITGASSGIGEALAHEFARQGADLALAARRLDRLRAVAFSCEKLGSRVRILQCDVTRDNDVETAINDAREEFGRIDVVVANAGFGVAGPVEKLELDDFRRQFETNVFGVIRTVKATLDDLKKSRGRLVLIGSVAGHVALPGNSPYSMSKFAVRALADALHSELKPYGISTTLISPGFVDSEIRKVDNRGELHEEARDPIPRWIRVSSKSAAREIVRAVRLRERERVVTGHGKAIVAVNRLAPFLINVARDRGLKARPEPGQPVTGGDGK